MSEKRIRSGRLMPRRAHLVDQLLHVDAGAVGPVGCAWTLPASLIEK